MFEIILGIFIGIYIGSYYDCKPGIEYVIEKISVNFPKQMKKILGLF